MVEPIPASSALFVYSLAPCVLFFFYAIGGSVILDLYDDGVCDYRVKGFLVASVAITYTYLAFYFSVILRPLPLFYKFHKKWFKIFSYVCLNLLMLAYIAALIALGMIIDDQACKDHVYYKMAAASIAIFAFYFVHQFLVYSISQLRRLCFCCWRDREEERLAAELEVQWAMARQKERERENEWVDEEQVENTQPDTELETIAKELKRQEIDEIRTANLERKRLEMKKEEEEKESEEMRGSGGKKKKNRRGSYDLIEPTPAGDGEEVKEFAMDGGPDLEMAQYGLQEGKEETAFERQKKLSAIFQKRIAGEPLTSDEAAEVDGPPRTFKQLESMLAPFKDQIDLQAILEREKERILAEDRLEKVELLRRERLARNAAQLSEAEKRELLAVAAARQNEIEKLRLERELRKQGKSPREIANFLGSEERAVVHPGADGAFRFGALADEEFGIAGPGIDYQGDSGLGLQPVKKKSGCGLRGSSAPEEENEDSMLGGANGVAMEGADADDPLMAADPLAAAEADPLIDEEAPKKKKKKSKKPVEDDDPLLAGADPAAAGGDDLFGQENMDDFKYQSAPEPQQADEAFTMDGEPAPEEGEKKKKKKKKKAVVDDNADFLAADEGFPVDDPAAAAFPADPLADDPLLAGDNDPLMDQPQSQPLADEWPSEDAPVKKDKKKKKKKKAPVEDSIWDEPAAENAEAATANPFDDDPLLAAGNEAALDLGEPIADQSDPLLANDEDDDPLLGPSVKATKPAKAAKPVAQPSAFDSLDDDPLLSSSPALAPQSSQPSASLAAAADEPIADSFEDASASSVNADSLAAAPFSFDDEPQPQPQPDSRTSKAPVAGRRKAAEPVAEDDLSAAKPADVSEPLSAPAASSLPSLSKSPKRTLPTLGAIKSAASPAAASKSTALTSAPAAASTGAASSSVDPLIGTQSTFVSHSHFTFSDAEQREEARLEAAEEAAKKAKDEEPKAPQSLKAVVSQPSPSPQSSPSSSLRSSLKSPLKARSPGRSVDFDLSHQPPTEEAKKDRAEASDAIAQPQAAESKPQPQPQPSLSSKSDDDEYEFDFDGEDDKKETDNKRALGLHEDDDGDVEIEEDAEDKAPSKEKDKAKAKEEKKDEKDDDDFSF